MVLKNLKSIEPEINEVFPINIKSCRITPRPNREMYWFDDNTIQVVNFSADSYYEVGITFSFMEWGDILKLFDFFVDKIDMGANSFIFILPFEETRYVARFISNISIDVQKGNKMSLDKIDLLIIGVND